MSDSTRNDQVADLIAQRRKAARSAIVADPEPVAPAPLTSVQLGLWTRAALHGRDADVNRPAVLRIKGPLDHDVLADALFLLVERHEPLRTSYPLATDEPVQQIMPPQPVELTIVGPAGTNAGDSGAGSDRLVADAIQAAIDAPLDLERAHELAAVLVVESAVSHVLVLGISHLAFDGWSEAVLRDDLRELYRACAVHDEPQLPELGISYGDYARWERSQVRGDAVEAHLRYWHGELAGLGTAPALPQRERVATPVVGNRIDVPLSPSELTALNELARAENTTPFVVLLTALELSGRELLDAEDFVVSCPLAGRDRPETHDLVGCFINPAFLRSSRFSASQTNLDHLRAVRSKVVDALSHRSVPARAVLEPWRRQANPPVLGRLSLQWRDFPIRRAAVDSPIDIEIVDVATQVSGLDWQVTPTADGATVSVEFDGDAYSAERVRGWIDRFRQHLHAVCREGDRVIEPVDRRPLPPDPTGPLEADRIEPVVDSIARQVEMAPDAVAIRDEAAAMSYAELWAQSSAVVDALMRRGVAAGDPVALLTHRNPGHVVALVAILRAGAVAVPLDAALPAGRRALMVDAANVQHGIVVGDLDEIDGLLDASIRLGRNGAIDAPAERSPVDPHTIRTGGRPPEDDRAYLMFTSGTTGKPKGVIGTHQGLSHLISWQRSRLGVRPGDVVAGIASASFDVSLREIFLPLTSGATLAIAPATLAVDRGVEWLATSHATIVHITPSLAAAWMAEGRGSSPVEGADSLNTTMRWTVFAGEPLTADIVEHWRTTVAPLARVMNFYGPTETCMIKASHEVSTTRPGVQPVGTPVAHTQLLVVAVDEPRLCQPGEAGELVIRTAIGTQGYLGAVSGGFEPNPFAPESGETVYRTGDVAWYEPDWSVTVQGRFDDQVKIDGIRVEPGGSASLLGGHAAVGQCVVVPVNDEQGHTRLEAFVVPEGEPPSARDLRDYLRRWLRPAEIPAAFHIVTRIPLTTNNKTDRNALLIDTESLESQPGEPEAGGADHGATTGTDLVEVVADIWQQVLENEHLSGSSDFFSEGGTSLRGLRVLAQIEARTGVAGDIDLFFDHPTLDEFIDAIGALPDGGSRVAQSDSPAHTSTPGDAVPLSYVQEGFWVIEQLYGRASHHILRRVLQIDGALDVDALAHACRGLVERHAVLRSRIVAPEGTPLARLDGSRSVDIEHHDLRHLSGAELDQASEEMVEAACTTPFDLASDLPVRFTLLRVSDEQWVLAICAHHMVVDGLSMRILLEELAVRYRAAVDHTAPDLPALDAQYADYATWQRRRAADGGYDTELDYWERVLESPPPPGLVGTGDPAGDPSVSVNVSRDLGRDFADRLGAVAAELGVSPFMVVLALTGGAVCDATAADEMIAATVFADRSWPAADKTIGCFVNILPVRLANRPGQPLREAAQAARAAVLDAHQHADVPFGFVHERLDLDRADAATFASGLNVNLVDLDLAPDGFEIDGAAVRSIDTSDGLARFDLSVTFETSTASASLRLEGRSTLYSETDLERLADRLVALSAAGLADLDHTVRAHEPEVGSDDGETATPQVLSYAQERLWIVEQLSPDVSHYVVPVALRIRGALDVGALQEALATVVARHDVLRSRIGVDMGEPQLAIVDPHPVDVDVHDLRDLEPEARDERSAVLVRESAQVVFDLAHDPPFWFRLVRLADDEWVLTLSFHHIVIDGYSFAVFYDELAAAYDAALGGTTPDLAPLAAQYVDYAIRQRELAASQGYEHQLAHWERQLAAPPPPAPRGTPDPHADPDVAVLAQRRLPASFATRLTEVANGLRVSPNMLVLALVAGVVCDETGADDMAAANVIADTSWAPAGTLIGYFVNTVPVRIAAPRGASLVDTAVAARAVILEAYAHGDVPLDLILERLRLTREAVDRLVNAIDVNLVDGTLRTRDPALSGTEVERLPKSSNDVKFDLAFSFSTIGEHPTVEVKGRSSLYAQADVDRMVDRLAELAVEGLADPTVPVRASAARAASGSANHGPLVPDRVRALALAQPDAIAVEAGAASWTRADLHDRASRVAAHLLASQVQPGDRVVVAAHRSLEMVAAMYGIWAVGASYVPLDLANQSERSHAVIEQSDAALVLSDDPALDAPVPLVLLSAAVGHRRAHHDWVAPQADSGAYVIFTSGSTGEPKGVEISHGALAEFVDNAAERYGTRSTDVVLQFHSLAFDASVEELHMSLALGATVVLRPPDLLGSARRLIELVETHSITVVAVPTAFWHELVTQMQGSNLQLPGSVRMVVIGGEAVRADLVRAWHELHPTATLINSYGPTEATVSVAAGVIGPEAVDGAITVGRPFSGVAVAVVDPDDCDVAEGEWGELLVSGPQLAQGYLNDPESTAAAFVSRADGRRWYRTGDRARVDGDGRIAIAGRLDRQVKIDGFRIEPAEVEHALRELDDVVDAAVLGVSVADRAELHAVVVAASSADELRRQLSELLPPAMVPSRFHHLDALPLGVSGKVDQAALRRIVGVAQPPSVLDSVAAPTEQATASSVSADVTERLAALWREVLGAIEFDPSSDFFELGGRSLTAVRLGYLIENEFDVSLPVATIFESAKLGELAACISASATTSADIASPPLPAHTDQGDVSLDDPQPDVDPSVDAPVDDSELVAPASEPDRPSEGARQHALRPAVTRPGPTPWVDEPVRLHLDLAPLGPAQQRMWLHQQLRGDTLAYRIPLRFRLRGALDRRALADAVDHVVARHEALRTVIVVAGGRPLQQVSTPPVGTLGVQDLTHLDPAERAAHADRVVASWSAAPFDLTTDLPFEALLLPIGAEEHQLALRFHHIAVDERAISIVLDDLESFYRAAVTGEPARMDPTLQFSDYAVWQRARIQGGRKTEAVAFWKEQLGDAPRALDLPGRLPDARPGGSVVYHDVDLRRGLSSELLTLADEVGLSPFQLLVAITSAAMHRITGAADVIVGAPGSERTADATDTIVGMLVNTMVLPSRFDDNTTFRDLLLQVRRMVGRAIDDGGVPFDLLIDALDVPRDPDRVPLVSVMCTMHEQGQGDVLQLGDAEAEPLASGDADAALITDLMVRGSLDAEGVLRVELRHDDQVLEPWVVAEVSQAFARVVEAIVAQPDAPVADAPLLSADEQHWLAYSLNQNNTDYPGHVRVERSVADMAMATPEAIAVVDRRRSITYRELVDEARALAGDLRAVGVERGDTVAVSIDRSAELVVALLGVLEAGAIYVPVDGAAPVERVELVQDLAGAQALLLAGDTGGVVAEATNRPRVPLPSESSETPAYVMFTSGSTGVPKGAVISHRAIQRTVQNIDYAPLGPSDVVAMASNPAFDALTFEIWGALLNGARLEVLERDTLGDPKEFASQLVHRGVTAMFLTTSLVNLIVAAEPDAFSSLDTLIVGGEALDVGTTRSLTQRGPRRLVNGYGPTECTTFSVWHLIEEVPDDAWTIPIGGPTRNTSLFVVDNGGSLVPRGLPGELCIAGPGVALGYLGDAELSASRFVQLVINGEPVRVYRTGDLVRRRRDGTIEYLGRRDHQIKLRGFRIELSDIETALLRNANVGAAAVRLVGEGTHRRLVAYVAPAPGGANDEASIRRHLAEQLPSYMLPGQYILLDSLPLNQSGKVDRRALPDPEPVTSASVATHDDLSDVESEVLEIWAQMLGRGDLGADDDFFDQGGNSLLGVELLAAVEERYGLHFRLSTLFEARTARQLANLIDTEFDASGPAAPAPHLVTLQKGDPSETPLWLIHPAGGSLVLYEPLARHLPDHRHLVGVEASGLDGQSDPLDSVPALADHQVETILRVQPHGPYRLLGYSIGGIIGHEVARRLMARGEVVELLAAVESGVPSGPPVLPSRREKYGTLLRRRDFRGIGESLAVSFRNRRAEHEMRREVGRSELDRAHKRVLDSMVHAFHQFVPAPLDIEMQLLYGDDSSEESVDGLCERWGQLALRGISLRRVSGSHSGDVVLRDPHAELLAVAVEDVLSACDQESQS